VKRAILQIDCRRRNPVPGSPAVALALLLILLSACKQSTPGTADQKPPELLPQTPQSPEREPAARLIRQLVEQAGGERVAVEIDHEALQRFTTAPESDRAMDSLRDPLRAARLFAAEIGLPTGAEFQLLQQSGELEEASGLFIALVQVISGEESVTMRMISEPDLHERPTIWVLNDFTRSESS